MLSIKEMSEDKKRAEISCRLLAETRKDEKSRFLKVFIADHSTTLRDRLKALFSGIDGIIVNGQAEDIPGTICGLEEKKPEVVILDLPFSEGSAVEVLKKIKNDKLDSIAIVFTDYAFPHYRRACFEAGADFFLDKATEIGVLVKILKLVSYQLTRLKKIRGGYHVQS